MSYEDICLRLAETVGIVLDSGQASGKDGSIILTIELTLEDGEIERNIKGSQWFNEDALNLLEAGLLRTCALARCECGQISPYALDPVSGYICEACES